MSRILALDIGGQRTGFAITDEEQIIAQALPFTAPLAGLKNKISEIQKDYGFEKIVVGLPKSMSGFEGRQAELVRQAGELIRKEFGCPVEFFDERLTTKQVMNFKGLGIDMPADSLVAQQILQDYLKKSHNP